MVKTNTVILHIMHVYGEKCFNGVEYKLDGAIYRIIWRMKHHSVSSSVHHVCYLYMWWELRAKINWSVTYLNKKHSVITNNTTHPKLSIMKHRQRTMVPGPISARVLPINSAILSPVVPPSSHIDCHLSAAFDPATARRRVRNFLLALPDCRQMLFQSICGLSLQTIHICLNQWGLPL